MSLAEAVEIIERDQLVDHAARVDAWFLGEMQALAGAPRRPMTNVRGLRLMGAVDMPTRAVRDADSSCAVDFSPESNPVSDGVRCAGFAGRNDNLEQG